MHTTICLKYITTPQAVHLYPLLNTTATKNKNKKEEEEEEKKRKESKKKKEKKRDRMGDFICRKSLNY